MHTPGCSSETATGGWGRTRLRGSAATAVIAFAGALATGGSLTGAPVIAAADGAGTITTAAGGGVGDGGPANQAALYPQALAVDGSGALYITDRSLARVRKVSRGIITTIAGTGEPGDTGDGGPATQARIGVSVNAGGIAVARSGDVYIVDAADRCVRRIDPHGIITTVVSNMLGPSGAVAVDSAGNLYVADESRILEYPASGGLQPTALIAGGAHSGYNGDGIPAVAAEVSVPQGMAFDASDNLYIADTGNNLVRRIDAASRIISTVLPQSGQLPQLPVPGGVPSPQYTNADTSVVSRPAALAVGRNGLIYVADTGNNRVLQVSLGVSSSSLISVPYPRMVAVSPSGTPLRVYTDSAQPGTAVYDQFGTVVAGAGTATFAAQPLRQSWAVPDDDGAPAIGVAMTPVAVAVDPSGGLVVADVTRIRRVTPSGRIETVAGTGVDPRDIHCSNGASCPLGGPGVDPLYGKNLEGARARAVNLEPVSLAVAPNGDVYFGDAHMHQVLRVGGDGILHVVAGNSAHVGDITVGVVNDGDGGPARAASFSWPGGLALASDGTLYIANAVDPSVGNLPGTVRRVDRAGYITTVAGSGTTCHGSVPDPQVAGAGPVPGVGDGGPATQACLDGPQGLALDRAGNLYVAEAAGNRVRRIDTQGIITTVAGTGGPSEGPAPSGYGLFLGDGRPAVQATLDQPTDVAVDSAGDLFIADASNQEVREVDTSGTIHTIAGSAQQAYTARAGSTSTDTASLTAPPSRGDGGPDTSSFLILPVAVALDAKGNLYIGDLFDQRVRRIEAAGTAQHASRAAGIDDAGALSCAAALDQAIENAFVLSPHAAEHRMAHADGRVAACTAGAATGHGGGVRAWLGAPDPIVERRV